MWPYVDIQLHGTSLLWTPVQVWHQGEKRQEYHRTRCDAYYNYEGYLLGPVKLCRQRRQDNQDKSAHEDVEDVRSESEVCSSSVAVQWREGYMQRGWPGRYELGGLCSLRAPVFGNLRTVLPNFGAIQEKVKTCRTSVLAPTSADPILFPEDRSKTGWITHTLSS